MKMKYSVFKLHGKKHMELLNEELYEQLKDFVMTPNAYTYILCNSVILSCAYIKYFPKIFPNTGAICHQNSKFLHLQQKI